MPNFVDDLQFISFVVHEEKIYDVVHDDIRSQEMTLMCTLSPWSMIWNCYRKKVSMCTIHMVKKLSVCMQCCFAP